MKKGDDTRQKIIHATMDLLMEGGYHAAGLNQIVRRSGAPRGSLYFHFPGGKEEIVAEALIAAREWMIGHLRDVLFGADEMADAVAEALLSFAEIQDRCAHGRGCALAAVAQETDPELVQVNQALRQGFSGIRELFVERFRHAGFPREDAGRWSDLAVSALEGAQVLSRAEGDSRSLRNSAELLRQILSTASSVAR